MIKEGVHSVRETRLHEEGQERFEGMGENGHPHLIGKVKYMKSQ